MPFFELFISILPQGVSDYRLYLDKVYAIREFSLNRLLMLQPISIFYLFDGGPVDIVQADYPIFDLSFTNAPLTEAGLPSLSTV